MITAYLTDIVKLENITTDKYGVKTKSLSDEKPARVLDTNRLIINSQGQEVRGSMKITMEYPQTIDENGNVYVIYKNGKPYEHATKAFKIISVVSRAGFTMAYLEIVV
jgi:peroxiredoxin